MIKFDKIYNVHETDFTDAKKIAKELNISLLTAKVLLNRGLNTKEECMEFLTPDLSNLLDPFLLNDMDKAVDKIIEKIKSNERICIYGDYDADGITSISVLKMFFDKIAADSFYYIPNRLDEGYGLNKTAIDYIYNKGASLVITVDCGVSDFKEVDYLNKHGVDVIITDHHQCEEKLPGAYAIINPNRKDSTYPFKALAGVGVALKLVRALAKKMDISLDLDEILPLVTIGTVSDVVPLIDENRIIVGRGLEAIKNSKNIGLKALLDVSNLKGKDIYSYHIGFILGPRLNAIGRLGLAEKGVELFLTESPERAMALAQELDKENKKRQGIENKILKDAYKKIEDEIDLEKEKVIVLHSQDWHSGVVGIVASRIVEKYNRPTILFAAEEDKAKGSGRSIPTFNLYENLEKCKDYFIGFGGHEQAAGISIKTELIDDFRREINEIANEILDEYDLIPGINVECEIDADDINLKTARELKILEPHGVGNPSPRFILKDGVIKKIRKIGKKKNHLKLLINKNLKDVDAVGFNFGDYADILDEGEKVNIITTLDINEYMGRTTPQLIVKDISNTNGMLMEEYYSYMEEFLSEENDANDIEPDFKFSTLNNSERLESIVQHLKADENLLLMVFNYYNAEKILHFIQMAGRDILKNTSISFKKPNNEKINDIVILPRLEDIDFSIYDRVIVYDISFGDIYLDNYLKQDKTKVEILANRKDITLNRKLLNDIIPTVDELRFFYKMFFNTTRKAFKIEPKTYFNAIKTNFNIDVSRLKFNLILKIFKDSKFLNYIYKDGVYFIKILSKPNVQLDILEQPILKYLYSLQEL